MLRINRNKSYYTFFLIRALEAKLITYANTYANTYGKYKATYDKSKAVYSPNVLFV